MAIRRRQLAAARKPEDRSQLAGESGSEPGGEREANWIRVLAEPEPFLRRPAARSERSRGCGDKSRACEQRCAQHNTVLLVAMRLKRPRGIPKTFHRNKRDGRKTTSIRAVMRI